MRNLANIKNHFGTIIATSGKYSFSIVNNKKGRRITLSSSLASKLGIDSEAFFMIDDESNELLISSNFPYDGAVKATVCGDDKKTAYSASLVASITEAFKLDFTGITSRSFNNISFEEDVATGDTYAVVKIISTGGKINEDNIEKTA